VSNYIVCIVCVFSGFTVAFNTNHINEEINKVGLVCQSVFTPSFEPSNVSLWCLHVYGSCVAWWCNG